MIMQTHVIGMGRLGAHLADRLEHQGMAVHRWSRSPRPGVRPIAEWDTLEANSAVFLAVPDDAIRAVADSILSTLQPDTLLVHHAGAVPVDVLEVDDRYRAVFWPPMTFSAQTAPDWSTLPLGVESTDEKWFNWAARWAPCAFRLTAESRPKLHLGAVLSGNLTAAWIGTVETYLSAHGLTLDILAPLIEESVSKALIGNALKTVSGPASRNDRTTLSQQLAAMDDPHLAPPELAALHHILTNLILRHNGHPPLPPLQATPGGH